MVFLKKRKRAIKKQKSIINIFIYNYAFFTNIFANFEIYKQL